jgi:hypothetical protein
MKRILALAIALSAVIIPTTMTDSGAAVKPHVTCNGGGNCFDTTITFSWYDGTSAAQEFGFKQTTEWYWQPPTINYIKVVSNTGYPWVAWWAEGAFSYVGEYTNGGYPYWSQDAQVNGAGYRIICRTYRQIQQFKEGYGPAAAYFDMRLWNKVCTDGTSYAGRF